MTKTTYSPMNSDSPWDLAMRHWMKEGAPALAVYSDDSLDEFIQIANQKLDTPVYADDERMKRFVDDLNLEWTVRSARAKEAAKEAKALAEHWANADVTAAIADDHEKAEQFARVAERLEADFDRAKVTATNELTELFNDVCAALDQIKKSDGFVSTFPGGSPSFSGRKAEMALARLSAAREAVGAVR